MLNEEQLDALDGVNFVTDPGGRILAVGSRRWDSFALQNNAPQLTGRWVISENLFKYISGPDVRRHLKQAMQKISTGADLRLAMLYRCDSPSHRRIMRQTITPIRSSGTCEGLLFQSVVLRSHERQPIDLFDFTERERVAELETDLPGLMMCSWCQRVQAPPLDHGSWIEADSYCAAGGSANVAIIHAICESCSVTAVPR